MPRTVSLHQIEDLAKGDVKNSIVLQTKLNTELYIIVEEDSTVIQLPFGNKFDIVAGRIIIHEKIK